MNEKEAIKEALINKYLLEIVATYQSNGLKKDGWQKVDFKFGTESPGKLEQMVKQLIYDMATAKADEYIKEHVNSQKEKDQRTEKRV